MTFCRGFNGPATRLEIAKSSDYISHPVFEDYVKWDHVVNRNSALVSTTKVNPDGSADIVIVGTVSNDRANLGVLGNWNDSFGMKFHKIKQQFTLKRPVGFVGFEDDFDIAITRLKKLQDDVAVKGSNKLWFVLEDDTLRFTHQLFQEKVNLSI